jgi:hypothetical protein
MPPPPPESVTLTLTPTEAKMICLLAYRNVPAITDTDVKFCHKLRDLAKDLDFSPTFAAKSPLDKNLVSSEHIS